MVKEHDIAEFHVEWTEKLTEEEMDGITRELKYRMPVVLKLILIDIKWKDVQIEYTIYMDSEAYGDYCLLRMWNEKGTYCLILESVAINKPIGMVMLKYFKTMDVKEWNEMSDRIMKYLEGNQK